MGLCLRDAADIFDNVHEFGKGGHLNKSLETERFVKVRKSKVHLNNLIYVFRFTNGKTGVALSTTGKQKFKI